MYKTIEEANQAAADAEWQSINFEEQRDIPVEDFKERMNICRSCDKLNIINFCTECNCFMPLKTRIRIAQCPMDKWKVLAEPDLTPSPTIDTQE
jgi:hypothetical protein